MQATDEGGVKYVLQDYQGSSRAIVSNSGYVNARMDYTAFGEEIQSNIGQRTAQGYAASNTLDQKYALTERDKATGLDHTWFRKLENQAGRWTSPDPYNGSMSLGNPQSFNRYSYVNNQPTNYVDPSGLLMSSGSRMCFTITREWYADGVYSHSEYVGSFCIGGGGNSGGGSSGGFGFGGSAGGGGSTDDKEYSNCVTQFNRTYPSLPTITKEQHSTFNIAKKLLFDKFGYKEGQATSIDILTIGIVFTSVVAVYVAPAILTGTVGGPVTIALGLVIGVVAGIGVGIFKSAQRRDEFEFDIRQLAEKYPEAAQFHALFAAKMAAQSKECDKFLKS